MTVIQNIAASEGLDSQGCPMLECTVSLECGALGRASAPAGVPDERFDEDPKRYWGRGLGVALSHVRDSVDIAVRGMDSLNQSGIDRTLDNLDSLAGNARLVVSLAVAQAAALAVELPLCRYLGGVQARRLPCPIITLGRSLSGTQFEEFLLVWKRTNMRFRERLRACAEISHAFEDEICNRGLRFSVGFKGIDIFDGDERDILDCLRHALDTCGYSDKDEVAMGLASPMALADTSQEARRQALEDMLKEYPLAYVELDWSDEEIAAVAQLPEGKGVMFCGNSPRCRVRCLDMNAETTLTRLLERAAAVHESGKTLVLSAMTPCAPDDVTAADIAVATRAEYVRFGSLLRGETVAKYNQLLRIEEAF